MDTLEPGDVQSVKHEEATLRRAKSHLHRWPPYPTELWKPRKKRLRWGLWAGANQKRLQDVARSWEKMHTRERTRARARRENDEVDVDCRNTLEDIHHTLVANNDVECMLAQVEGYSRNRKLDELWCGRGHSWNAGADHKLTTGCQSGCLKHSSAEEQLGRVASNWQDVQRRETR